MSEPSAGAAGAPCTEGVQNRFELAPALGELGPHDVDQPPAHQQSQSGQLALDTAPGMTLSHSWPSRLRSR